MTAMDLVTLLPLIMLATSAVAVMLAIAIRRNLVATTTIALLGLVLAFVSLPVSASTKSPHVTSLLIMDNYALFYIGLIIAASFVVVVLSHGYMRGRVGEREEFFILLLLATLGSAVLVASNRFASFFLGLEILSVSLYALIAYPRLREKCIEAGVKYLILAAASAAFLVFGMALIYAELGTMDFARIAAMPQIRGGASALLLAGQAMLIVGIGFKLALVPFHMWTADVYEGAPAPTTAFVATLSKGAMFALLLRYFTQFGVSQYSTLFLVFSIIAVASMLVGNLLALLQNNVKRILAYSSIAHLGYILVAFLASGPLAITAVTFYLVAYFVTTLGAFGVITALSGRERDLDSIDDYRGLVWRRPYLAGTFTAMLLSLAGMPLTAGFIGKFYITTAAVGSALWALVLALVVASTIGLFYYLRVATVLYLPPSARNAQIEAPSLSWATGVVLAVLSAALVCLGIYPAPLVALIQAMVASLS